MTNAIDPQRWAEAMASFEAWAEVAEPERAAWLEALAAARPELHALVVTLIHADSAAEHSAFLSPDAQAAGEVATLEGRRLGPWQIERLIGSGGMGQVWLARRTDALYDGLAAIKLMRLSTIDPGSNERFAREGQLLGRLSHSNIARLLDAGVTATGERYLVLEYVDGERIDRWCDQRRLSFAERIALFIVVCKAVAHAHENLVVHRDLKPSNIFVTTDGEVKLLDFGVAKLIEADPGTAGDATDLTRSGGAAMTPGYASPEQLSGGTITTATDVYSLGVVLYGLLSGQRPFGDEGAPQRSARRDSEPRPLWSLPADGAAAEHIAALRRSSVAALRKALHGDVAVAIGKAIKADPAERYRQVLEFADDLQRTLEQRPIAARPDSVAYRGAKFMRRHWFGVGAAALVALAIVAGVSGTLLKQREAERQAREAEHQAGRAVAVKRFLLDLFDQARTAVKANGTQAREATINDMLSAGADHVDHSFAAQPEIRDEVFGVLVDLYSETDNRERMTALVRRRLAAARASFGADDPRTVPAEVQLSGVLLNYGDADEAKALLDHASVTLDRVGDATSVARAHLLRWQGVYAQYHAPQTPWSTHPLRRAVELMRERYPDDDNLLEALMGLPGVACRSGHVDDALAAADELQQRALARYGADNMFTAEAMAARGNLLMLAGRPAEAIPLLQQSVAGFARFAGPKSPDVIAVTITLAQANFAAGQPAEAQQLIDPAAALIHAEYPDDARLANRLVAYKKSTEKILAGQRPHCGG
jgi:hypothetical protein